MNLDERYLYQGWNLTVVYATGDFIPVETHTWGKGLDGSIQGAGGVGGLLFAKKRSHSVGAWIYHYDASGNVTEVTNKLSDLLDQYQYNLFGMVVNEIRLHENRYRFSTKVRDQESGLWECNCPDENAPIMMLTRTKQTELPVCKHLLAAMMAYRLRQNVYDSLRKAA